MKLKSILILFILLIGKAGTAQTEHAAINEAWAKLNKAYLLRNESIMNITDTLHKREAISSKAYSDLAKQIREFAQMLTTPAALSRKLITRIEDQEHKLSLAFGKLILTSGAKGPDHYYLDQLEGLENRLEVCKRVFNDVAKANGRKNLVLPLASVPQVKF